MLLQLLLLVSVYVCMLVHREDGEVDGRLDHHNLVKNSSVGRV